MSRVNPLPGQGLPRRVWRPWPETGVTLQRMQTPRNAVGSFSGGWILNQNFFGRRRKPDLRPKQARRHRGKKSTSQLSSTNQRHPQHQATQGTGRISIDCHETDIQRLSTPSTAHNLRIPSLLPIEAHSLAEIPQLAGRVNYTSRILVRHILLPSMVARRPLSPTHAFDPTPALEHHPDNFSPLTHSRTMGSSVDFSGGRLSDPSSLPVQNRHSAATSDLPLLSQVPSASQLPKASYQLPNPTPGVPITVYMEQCRAHLKLLRQSHESERITWETEANELRARIAELEQGLVRKSNGKRRLSNELSNANLNSFGSNILPVTINGISRGRMHSEPTISGQPVWRGPETTPPVTRVFTHDDDVKHLPSISEDGVSPTSAAQENIPVPVEQVDKSLDGITLKKAALTSSFDKEITSPQFISPVRSPPPLPKKDEPLKLGEGTLLPPLDEKLKLHAGHTPRAYDGALSSDGTSAAVTPKQEKPIAPAPTKRSSSRPSENSDSYFGTGFSHTSAGEESRKENQQEGPEPVLEAKDDPALKGPLMLDSNANTAESATFLNALDAKLIEEKEYQERTESKLSGNSEEKPPSSDQQAAPSNASKDDEMPLLKMKRSTNFGSAWGGNIPGRMA